MKKFKLKAIAILLSSGMAGGALAEMHQDTNAELNKMKPADVQTKTNDATLTNDVKAVVSGAYADKINVSSRGGVIYLAGELPSDTDYENVIVMANSIKGVQDVNVDALTVKDSKNPLYDTYITAKVKGLLIQKNIMGEDIPGWTLGVETKDGVVYLSGTVNNEQEKQKIKDVAKSIQGVTSVEDKTHVQAMDSDETDTVQPQASDNGEQSQKQGSNQKQDKGNTDSKDDGNDVTQY